MVFNRIKEFQITRKHNVSEIGYFSPVLRRGERAICSVGLRSVLATGPIRVGVSLHLRMENGPVSETMFFSIQNFGRSTKSINPLSLSD
jgi:hypothetical protein